MPLVPSLYLWYFRRYERRGRKVRAPHSARSTAPWERRRRLTPIVEINFEVWGKVFTPRYFFKKCEIFWDIWSWKLGEKNTFLGARGQGGHRRGSTPISRNKVSVRTKLFFPRSFVEKRDRFGDNLITKTETLKQWNSETLKQWTVKQWNTEIFEFRKNFFCSIFLGPKGVRIRKKKKVSFSKFDTFPPPASRNKAQGLTPSGSIPSTLTWYFVPQEKCFFLIYASSFYIPCMQ